MRTAEGARVVETLDALIAELEAGALEPAALVRAPGSSRWQRLADVLAPAPVDPWAAWEEMDGKAPARSPQAAARPSARVADADRPPTTRAPLRGPSGPALVPELDVAIELSDDPVTEPPERPAPPRVAPIIQPPVSATRAAPGGRVVDAPGGAASAPPPSPVAAPRLVPPDPERQGTAPIAFTGRTPSTGPPDNIIAFPAGRRPQLDGQLALEEDALPPIPHTLTAALPPAPPRSPALGRVLRWQAIAIYSGVVVVCLLGLGLARWYVRESALKTYSIEPGASEAAVRPAASAAPSAAAPTGARAPSSPPAAPADAPIGAVYAGLEDELRGLMLADLLTIDASGELEDALFIELRRLRLDLISVDAEVTAWGGRKLDVPQAARFDVRLRASPDNVDRELAAVALVVGKYIHQYSLDVASFDVVLEGVADTPLRRPVDPVAARELYLQRRSLAAFIDGMRQ